MSKTEKINLENFEGKRKGIHINSPFSIKSLQSLGIEEKDLIILSFNDFINSNPDLKEVSTEIQKERYEYYLQKHKRLITEAKEKRSQLIEDNENETNLENTEKSMYHCELDETTNFYNPKGKSNPQCEKCNEYIHKYEKLKERMKLNIQLEIDGEYDKKEKMKKQIAKHKKIEEAEEMIKKNKIKDIYNINKKYLFKNTKGLEKPTNFKEVKSLFDSINEEYLEKMQLKQKELQLKDEKRMLQLEIYKKNNARNLAESYALKKEKVNKTLNDNDLKREEKYKIYYEAQKMKEEKREKSEKDKLMKRTLNSEIINRKKLNRLKKAIEI